MAELLPYLSKVCKESRKESGKRVTGVADAAGYGSATTINRFEKAEAWPRNPDGVVGAYAEGVEGLSPFDLWDEAIRRAKAGAKAPGVGDSGEPGGEKLQFPPSPSDRDGGEAQAEPS